MSTFEIIEKKPLPQRYYLSEIKRLSDGQVFREGETVSVQGATWLGKLLGFRENGDAVVNWIPFDIDLEKISKI